jgi:hypothetical protein
MEKKRWTIADAGSTGNFMTQSAPVINVKPKDNPIKITLSHRQTIASTHTCNLDIPRLPEAMTAAHIVPGMAHWL